MKKLTDFNDLYLAEGLDVVRERILVAAPASSQPVGDGEALGATDPDDLAVSPYEDAGPRDFDIPLDAYDGEFSALYGAPSLKDDNWREKLYCKPDGALKSNSLHNCSLILLNHPDYAGLICFDDFSGDKIVTRAPPWDIKPSEFLPRSLRDDDITGLAIHLERIGLNLPMQNLRKVVEVVIMHERRNPAKEYFSRLVWDSVPRLDTWLREYCGCTRDDNEYLAAIGRKWLVAAVNRVFHPGCKFDHVLIFEGSPNLGKSIMLEELATIHGHRYFDDTIKASDLLHSQVVPKLQGVLIIELSEMSGFKRMDKDAIKQIITSKQDRIVRKYENDATWMPRKFVFAGTINPTDGGYLDDPTGNRRYWPAYCTRIDMEAVKRDKEQLWAEAVTLYRGGEKIWLEKDLYKKAEAEQRKRQVMHPWQPDIEKLCDGKNFITLNDIWGSVHMGDVSKRSRQHQDDITKIMEAVGFEYIRKQRNGKREYGYARKEVEHETAEEEILWGSN